MNSDFLSLAPELLFRIFHFLDCRDILSCRKCNKTLHQATQQRIVWIDALLSVCCEYNVSAFTFPVDRMSLKALEYAATAHFRFTRRLWDGLHEDMLEPESIRILALSPRNHPALHIGEFCDLMLIPGGRFLLTATDTGLIQLWDLGFIPTTFLKRHAVDSVQTMGLDANRPLCVHPNSDGTGVLILALVMPNDKDSAPHLCFQLLELLLATDSPKFEHKGAFRFTLHDDEPDMAGYSLFKEHVVFWQGNMILMWNFVDKTYAQWKTSDPYETPAVNFLLFGDKLAVLQPPEVLVYKIPVFAAYDTFMVNTVFQDPQLAPALEPMVRYSFPGTSDHGFSLEAHWGHPQRGYLDAVSQDISTAETVVARSLWHYYDQPSLPPSMPTVFPEEVRSIRTRSLRPAKYKSLSLADDTQVVFSSTDVYLRVNLFKLDGNREIQQESGLLHDWRSIDMEDCYGCCPMTGRICVVAGEREIKVMDYVTFPDI
ncbi:hypothetical protein C8J56DRAFT_1162073 [Mycena floridula]|nr:hypothetical protein C8J56DRAFT_1162073 [Mycena floridula]